ncbi:MAG: helix-turn-helix domain-containing protein [Chloroflexi bacterium]|nr:MAG: helix-turn-helix domain-containing protein [Chloroflexota bacterium]
MLALVCTDEYIALFLNRNGRQTGMHNPCSAGRVTSHRKSHHIPAYLERRQQEEGWMNLTQAAVYLGAARATVRKAIEQGVCTGLHPLADSPWIIPRDDLDRPEVRAHFAGLRRATLRTDDASATGGTPKLPGL